METNDILKKLRTENGLTLGELSEKLDIHKTNLSDLENGRRKIGLSVLTKLADYYNVSLDYIMGREVVHDDRSDIEKISAENNLTDSDQEFLKQNQEQLVQLLKKKQNEIDELRKEIQELRAKYE